VIAIGSTVVRGFRFLYQNTQLNPTFSAIPGFEPLVNTISILVPLCEQHYAVRVKFERNGPGSTRFSSFDHLFYLQSTYAIRENSLTLRLPDVGIIEVVLMYEEDSQFDLTPIN
jgi:hypothetical protein